MDEPRGRQTQVGMREYTNLCTNKKITHDDTQKKIIVGLTQQWGTNEGLSNARASFGSSLACAGWCGIGLVRLAMRRGMVIKRGMLPL